MSEIINIFDAKRKLEKESKEKKDNEENMSFDEIIKKNEENRKRMAKDRERANKSVTRSYRLKK